MKKTKSTVRVTSNTGEQEWYTPVEIIDSARVVMGGIDLDPASSRKANSRVKAGKIYTKRTNGLTKPWRGRVFCNPPYNMPEVALFAKKATESILARKAEVVFLVNNATDTKWFHLLSDATQAVCFTRGRLRFFEGNALANGIERRNSPTYGQAIFYGGPNVLAFVEEFSRHGITFSRLNPPSTICKITERVCA